MLVYVVLLQRFYMTFCLQDAGEEPQRPGAEVKELPGVCYVASVCRAYCTQFLWVLKEVKGQWWLSIIASFVYSYHGRSFLLSQNGTLQLEELC